MLTLAQIQAEAYATACEKGWHDRPLREIGTFGMFEYAREDWVIHHDRVLRAQALMHTELTEAHEAIDEGHDELYIGENGKPEGLPAEAADLVIRVCDVTKALGLELYRSDEDWWTKAKNMRPAYEIQRQPDEHAMQQCAVLWLARVRQYVDQATEAARVDDWTRYADQLTFAVLYTASIVAGFGHDLTAAITVKMRYNKTRSHRHGGKQA